MINPGGRGPSIGMLGEQHLLVVVLITLIFAGWIGVLLNGQTSKGIWCLVITFGLVFLGFITCGLGFALLAIFEIALKIDAILIASKLQKGTPVRPNEWF